MKSTILLLAVILTLGVLFAAAQGNTFCSSSLPCTVSALWNFTGGLQNNGVAVPVLPINLTTQVTGTLPGANYAQVNLAASGNGGVGGVLPGANMAATNLAGGNNPGGVSGTLPLANLTTQGTDTNLLTSGTVSASTGVALCTDANHGATTSGCTAGGVSEMIFGWGGISSPGASASLCTVSGGVFSCPQILLPNAHTIKRLTFLMQTGPVGCSPNGVVGVWDFTSSSALTTITVSQASLTFVDSGVLSVATTAGHQLGVGWTTLPAGCGTFPTILSLTAILQ